MSPAVGSRAFDLKDKEVSEAVQSPQGYAFLTLTGKQDAKTPSLDEVKAKVREDVIKRKAVETARQKAASVSAQLKTGDFAAGAKAAGLEAKNTELVPRGSPISDVGVSPAVDAVAFTLPVGAVSDPIVTDNGAVVVKVVERVAVTDADLAKGRDGVRSELLSERRNQFYTRLHGEGARADADQRQPADHRANTRVNQVRIQNSGVRIQNSKFGWRRLEAAP